MSNTAKLLDRARELCVPATDYRLAKTLGVSAGRMSNWRRGKFPDNEAAFKLAELLGIPATEVIAYIEADRAKTDQQRSFWSTHLPRALPSIAIASAGLLALGGSLIDEKTEAPTTNSVTAQVRDQCLLCLILVMRRLARAFGPNLRATSPRMLPGFQ